MEYDIDKNSNTTARINGYHPNSYYETPDNPFREALKCITKQDPPEFVCGYSCYGYSDEELLALQDWATNVIVDAGYEWMTGIGTIEAAELMVSVAEDNGNVGTNPLHRKQK